jgi:hypothetical protein
MVKMVKMVKIEKWKKLLKNKLEPYMSCHLSSLCASWLEKLNQTFFLYDPVGKLFLV